MNNPSFRRLAAATLLLGLSLASLPAGAADAEPADKPKITEETPYVTSPKNVVDTMQTRMELYDYLDYHKFEQHLDALFAQSKGAAKK